MARRCYRTPLSGLSHNNELSKTPNLATEFKDETMQAIIDKLNAELDAMKAEPGLIAGIESNYK